MTSFEIFIIFLVVIVILSFAVNFAIFFYFSFYNLLPTLFLGAFFARTKDETAQKMLRLSGVKAGENVLDLGSGDGSLLIAIAKTGAKAVGYEINPMLVKRSKKNIQKAGLQNQASVHLKNFWSVDLSQFDVVFVYGISHMMKRLEEKLQKELKPGARVVSNHFTFPNWQYAKKDGTTYVYIR